MKNCILCDFETKANLHILGHKKLNVPLCNACASDENKMKFAKTYAYAYLQNKGVI